MDDGQSADQMLADFDYAVGAKLFVYDDGGAFVPYTI